MADAAGRLPPLLVVAGPSGVGKSTVCRRLAGTIPGAVLLDADVFARVIPSARPPADYPVFWRTLAGIAAEIAENRVAVVLFSVMLPSQLLGHRDLLDRFQRVDVATLTARPEVLAARLAERTADPGARAAADRWGTFADALHAEAAERLLTELDAEPPPEQVAATVEDWIRARLSGGRGGRRGGGAP